MSQVDIGVVESCDSWKLESRFFPSKVGGKPSWLDLKNIPSYDDLKCEYCNEPCIFLCQVYAPYEESREAFHRTLFVFICLNAQCCKPNKNGNVKVYRSQLRRENEFYPANPPEEDKNWRPDIRAEKWIKVCNICGILAPSHCAKCKQVNYCSRQHQILDWKESHKKVCGTEDKLVNNSLLFPENELVIIMDDSDVEDEIIENEMEKEEQEMKKFELLVESGKAGTMQSTNDIDDDLIKMANENEDKTFNKFRKEVNQCPDQVTRYERDGKPLYISDSNQAENIPKCDVCGGERQFEFQIMPQLLNFLNFTDSNNSIDYGVLLIFTCKKSCSLSSTYAKEYVWKQDIIQKK